MAPQLLTKTFFSGFSHTTEGTTRRGVNGFFYVLVMSDKTAIFHQSNYDLIFLVY